MRAELSEVRVAQDLVAADLARALAELRSIDARAAETQATVPVPPAAVTPAPPVRAAQPAPPPAATPASESNPGAGHDETVEQAFAAARNTFRAREHGQAVLDFLDFIAKYPKHPLAPSAQFWIGEAYFVQRDYPQALIEFNRVLQMAPTAPAAADALLRIGMCHASLREPAPAAVAWERILRDYPRSDAAGKARSFLRASRTPSR